MYDIIDEINDVQLLIETSTRCIQRPEAREKDNNQVKHMQKILPRFESFKRVVACHYGITIYLRCQAFRFVYVCYLDNTKFFNLLLSGDKLCHLATSVHVISVIEYPTLPSLTNKQTNKQKTNKQIN